MVLLALVLFIILPIVEIALLIKVAELISLGPTLLLIVATAVVGVFLLRRQGLSSMARAHAALAAGRLPVEGIYDAAGLMLAGAFLLTPGLITDTLGFALLIPAFRHALGRAFFGRMVGREAAGIEIFGSGRPYGSEDDIIRGDIEGDIIEGEAVELEEEKSGEKSRREEGRRRPSPWKR